LINPTFSTVREDKSYINLFHRNQSTSFKDNNQTYFLSYSGRIGDRSGLGLSLYTQREGVLNNYGVLANYAYGIKLNDKSNFTFGANVSYYNSGLDQNRVNTIEDDPFLSNFEDQNLLSFQPGFNISYGKFDFGVFAENLLDYNLKTSEMATEFADKTYSAHLQYTHQFENGSGIMEEARLMPLARVRKVGDEDVVLGGSLILDLPKLGWVQGGYDSFYGAAAGVGFNLGKRLSLGYTMEKGMGSNFDNFGVTHEISFAYSFTPTLTEDRVMLEEQQEEQLAQTEEIKEELTDKDLRIQELEEALASTNSLLDEHILKQDSIENSRNSDLERRFEQIMRMVRAETGGNKPDLEEKARQMYYVNNDKSGGSLTPQPNSNAGIPETENLSSILKENNTAVATNRNALKKTNTQTQDRTASPGIKRRKFKNLDGVAEGYYVVANVYKGKQYMNKFMEKMRAQGFEADYIDNTNNGLKYVYLDKFDNYQEALTAAESQLNGSYDEKLWIMEVGTSNTRYAEEAYAANTDKLKTKAASYDTDDLRKNVVSRDKVAVQKRPVATPMELDGVASGFYIIANVFANPRNANRFVKVLNQQGLSASYFINPKNNYRYVYIKKHESWNNALMSYYSKLNNSYDQDMWIMRVTSDHIA
jgi:type IX secretion system PorP/SprF family membrane protein